MTGAEHERNVNPSAGRVRQPLRRLALALRKPISADINRMLDEDNIERVDTTPWISNIVAALKHDNSVHVRVGLSAPNRAVIPEPYALPLIAALSS